MKRYSILLSDGTPFGDCDSSTRAVSELKKAQATDARAWIRDNQLAKPPEKQS